MPTTRRTHPPDRRTPTPVPRGQCVGGQQCGCCPGDEHRVRRDPKTGKLFRLHCPRTHPETDLPRCKQPFPAVIDPCPERATRNQDTPTGQTPAGRDCFECGRTTSRLYTGRHIPWLDVAVGWCAGDYPNPNPGDCPTCGWPIDLAARAGGFTTHPTCDEDAITDPPTATETQDLPAPRGTGSAGTGGAD